jgi:hypothetical protein
MFIVLMDFEKIGVVSGISFTVASLVTVLVGKIIDKRGTDLVHAIGTLVNGMLYIPRIFIGMPLGIYAMDILDKANSPFYALPNMSITYEKALKMGRSDFMIFREITIHFGVVVGCALGLVMILSGLPWRLTFFIPFLGSLLVYFMDLDKN